MRVLVCGGRAYNDWQRVKDWLDALHEASGVSVVIHGAAAGADSLADKWARANKVDVIAEPADWRNLSHRDAVLKQRRDGTTYDAMAGSRRNQLMLDQHRPNLVLAFPGGPGTADMAMRARQAGVRVIQVPLPIKEPRYA